MISATGLTAAVTGSVYSSHLIIASVGRNCVCSELRHLLSEDLKVAVNIYQTNTGAIYTELTNLCSNASRQTHAANLHVLAVRRLLWG
jgi:hypothetical protein